MSFEIDRNGVELIAGFEGFINGVYNDSRGLATCGYGHLLHYSRATSDDHRRYDGRGRAFFLEMLHADIERIVMVPMRHAIHAKLTQNQVNALASATFNCGAGFLYGTVGKLVNAGKLRQAAGAFMLWAHPSELGPRRQRESRLFLTTSAKAAVALPWLKPDERRWCQEYDRLLHEHRNIDRRRVLRHAMRARAVEIEYAAKHEGGWEKADRRHRWHSLMARAS